MERYLNLRGNSSVEFYSIQDNSITVVFKGSAKRYTYSTKKNSIFIINQLKAAAKSGMGLGHLINTKCRFTYDDF